jgi:hypothetical protein
VTSERKIAANRANARKSPGPKTAQGRARSARNALRHGLSLPIGSDPEWAENAETLAQQIAGPQANRDIRIIAQQIAETQLELVRVRQARNRMLAVALNDPDYEPLAILQLNYRRLNKLRQKLERDYVRKLRRNFRRLVKPPPPVPDDFFKSTAPKLKGPEKFAAIVSDKLRQLAALDRYEQRALSRRNAAIRALDAARRQQADVDQADG